jgi:hypothetical protein
MAFTILAGYRPAQLDSTAQKSEYDKLDTTITRP